MAKPNENDTPVGFKIPRHWLDRADDLTGAFAVPTTRTEVLRAAMARGLDELEAEVRKAPKRRK
jgi:hypothetical protein